MLTDEPEVRVAIVGCGGIGNRRARTLAGARLVACCDIVAARAETLARAFPGTRVEPDWRAAVTAPDVDAVVVATTHDMLAPVTRAAADAGKAVLVEKPGARRSSELDGIAGTVRVGFNHRYHRAFRKAREIAAAGSLGPLMFVRARYGHGGRPGYDREWRADPALSGGGELIDQGVHLIDLARSFLGEFTAVRGRAVTCFWDMPVEDNAFLLLATEAGQTAFLHASWTEWKNLFSFEIYGRAGKLEIAGLGGSYGPERLAWYRMSPEMGPPETIIWEYPMADDSWEAEFAEFLEDIRTGRPPVPGIADAQAALKVVETVYEQESR